MSSKLYLTLNRLSLRTRLWRLAQNLSSPAVSDVGQQNEATPTFTRSYCAVKRAKSSLYYTISPLGRPSINLKPVLDDWVQKGNKVHFAELDRIIRDLRKNKRFSQALEVSEWMGQKDNCKFSDTQHAVQLDLVGKVHGSFGAEDYFYSLPDTVKTEKTYGALLNCYVRQGETEKALSHFQKMKEMGFASSSITYNEIMSLYIKTKQHEKIPEVLAEMKQNKVQPDNCSYRICIQYYGTRSDIEGVENTLRDMQTQPALALDWNTYAIVADFYIKTDLKDKAIDALRHSEVRMDKKDGMAHNFLISLYARLEMKDDVLRLWKLQKTACKKCINKDYMNMLSSLVKLNALEEAEEVLKEWESSGNVYDVRIPDIIVLSYTKNGLPEKAEALLKDLREKGKSSNPTSWATVAMGYTQKSEMTKATECLNIAVSLCSNNDASKISNKVILRLLNMIGDKCSADDVDGFVRSLKSIVPLNRGMYHALIKARIRSGQDVDFLLDDMKAKNIEEDEETAKILSLRQNKI